MGIPFVPTLGYANSDVISERDDFTIAPNPFNPSEPYCNGQGHHP